MTDKEAVEQYSLLLERLVKVGIHAKLSKCIFFAPGTLCGEMGDLNSFALIFSAAEIKW